MRAEADRRRVRAAFVLSAAGLLAVVAIALLVGFLSGPGGTAADPSGSPQPSDGQSSSAGPSVSAEVPSPTDAASQPESPSATLEPHEAPRWGFAIALVDDLQVRERPGTDWPATGELQTGDAMEVEGPATTVDGVDWYRVYQGDLHGWASVGPDEQPYLDLRWTLEVRRPPAIRGIAAGERGFLAWGGDGAGGGLIVASGDGVHWERASLPVEIATGRPESAAWGPSGWILAVSGQPSDVPYLHSLWRSADGLDWTELAVPPVAQHAYAPALYGSPDAYLLLYGGHRAVMRSTDGRVWTDSPAEPDENGIGPYIISIPSGNLGMNGESGSDDWIFSMTSDGGANWVPVSGESRLPRGLGWIVSGVAEEAGGIRLIAVTTKTWTDAPAVWQGTLSGQSLEWDRLPDIELLLADSRVESVTAVGDSFVATGFDRVTGGLEAWRGSIGTGWVPIAPEGLFGGAVPPRWLVAAGPHGYVAVGQVVTLAGASPVLWHSPDGASWTKEPDPVLPPLLSPLAAPCPDLPTTMVDWLLVPPSVAVECFGDTAITFRAFHPSSPGDCETSRPNIQPAWLDVWGWTTVLSLWETGIGGCDSVGMHPVLGDPPGRGWMMVTGHYDDPEATTCRWHPDPQVFERYVDPESVVIFCRERFVVTEMVPAN